VPRQRRVGRRDRHPTSTGSKTAHTQQFRTRRLSYLIRETCGRRREWNPLVVRSTSASPSPAYDARRRHRRGHGGHSCVQLGKLQGGYRPCRLSTVGVRNCLSPWASLACCVIMRRGRGGGRVPSRGSGVGGGSGGGTAVPLLAAMASHRVVVLTADGRCVKVCGCRCFLLRSSVLVCPPPLLRFSVLVLGGAVHVRLAHHEAGPLCVPMVLVCI